MDNLITTREIKRKSFFLSAVSLQICTIILIISAPLHVFSVDLFGSLNLNAKTDRGATNYRSIITRSSTTFKHNLVYPVDLRVCLWTVGKNQST